MKRKQADHHHLQYVVMETKFVTGTFVEFMPQIWVIPPRNKKLVHEERSIVKFLFPRRLPNQSKDTYARYVKQAKFNCTPTERNEKWELRDGRILKMGLDSLEEALDAEKFYSDYFSTAEDEVQEPSNAPSAKRKFSKTKKVEQDKPMNDSESDEGEHEQNGKTISNYNICFQADDQFLNLYTLAGGSDVLGDFSQVMDDGLSELQSPVQAVQISQGTVFGEGNPPRVSNDLQIIESTVSAGGNLLDLSNEKFATIELPTAAIYESEDAADDDRYNNQQIDTIDQQRACCSSSDSCCKSNQKVLNKIDYLQKKWCKEMSVLRQESSSNRQLLLQVISLLRPTEGQTDKTVNGQIDKSGCDVAAEPILDMAELDEFNALYKKTFPIKSSEFIVDFNTSLKDDKKFAENMFKKLLQVKGDDETKTVRKILKELVDVRCLKDFTWFGTKKMKSFQDLQLIIAMISNVLVEKYPKCDAIDVIMKVVKQRTKSAKEAYVGLVAAEAATPAEAVPSVDKTNTTVLFQSASVSAEPNSGKNASGPSHVNGSLASAGPNSGITASGPSHVFDSLVSAEPISGINASGPSHVNGSLASAAPNSGITASGPSHVFDSLVSAEPISGINASGPSHVNYSLASAAPNSGITASGPSHVNDSLVAGRTINNGENKIGKSVNNVTNKAEDQLNEN